MPEIIETYEHCEVTSLTESELIDTIKNQPKLIEEIDLNAKIARTGYYIGLQQLPNSSKILFVKPKLDKGEQPTDFLEMLRFCLEHSDVYLHTDELFYVDFKSQQIEITQEEDLITPLIFVQFLSAVRKLIRRGLRRSYYRVEKNIRSSVKGKVLVAKTIKQNHLQNKMLLTYCEYDEFGLNSPENRLLKKALIFTNRYSKLLQSNVLDFSSSLNYIMPAFNNISEDIQEEKVKTLVSNPFFSDYNDAISLAKLILKRFGYNINAIDNKSRRLVPPFWIDMSKLFELYVLGKLKEHMDFRDVIFQADGRFGYVDFLRTASGKELVIDAKYKLEYKRGRYDIDDIRQLSAYARDLGIIQKLEAFDGNCDTIIKCLIIYPDNYAKQSITNYEIFNDPINQFEKFYKIGIRLPTIET